MANNGGPRVPPRPPPLSPAGVHHITFASANRGMPPPLPPSIHGGGGTTTGSGVRAPATMSISLPPMTAPLSPLGSRTHHHRLAPPTATLTRRVSPVRSEHNISPPPPSSPVTLSSPRPDVERVVNEYVETPFTRSSHLTPAEQQATVLQSINTGTTTLSPVPTLSSHFQSIKHSHHHHRPETLPLPPNSVVTKQPHATFTKNRLSTIDSRLDCPNGTVGVGGVIRTPIDNSSSVSGGGTIICPECGRCRCESCQQPRPLPQRWVCDKKCLCSVDAVIDYTSCLCCVKGLYYHCSKDYELDRDGGGVSCADEPCSCVPHRRFVRWGCLVALTVALPCLLCYWPLRGCARGVELLYAHHTRSGCRCRPQSSLHSNSHPVHHHQQETLTTPEKRLLDSSPDF